MTPAEIVSRFESMRKYSGLSMVEDLTKAQLEEMADTVESPGWKHIDETLLIAEITHFEAMLDKSESVDFANGIISQCRAIRRIPLRVRERIDELAVEKEKNPLDSQESAE